MASGSKNARWGDLATWRDSENDSEDRSSSESSFIEVREHAGEQSSSPSTSSSKDAAEDFASVQPYRFEPLADSSPTEELPSSVDVEERSERLTDLSWCDCGHCEIMGTAQECVCCNEVPEVLSRMREYDVNCSNCLDVWVLQTAYYRYHQEHELPPSAHE